jgi:hypothetical protein
MAVQTKIQFRRDTAANWTSAQTAAGLTPLLAAGEIGFDTTNNKFKIGDGTTLWGSLLYQTDASLLSGTANITALTTSGDVTVGGNLVVNGTTTTVNSTVVSVDDKNIELGAVATPTNTTADGGGLTLKGTTDKTLNWVNATTSWTSSENFDLASGKVYAINGSTVLSSTQVLGYGIGSANGASTLVARDASGNFAAGTITASLTGVASKATNIVAGTADKGELVYQSGVNTTSTLTATTTNNQVLAYNTSTNAPYWAAITGTGSVVLATNAVLTTPNIGTPSFATLTNATGYKVDNLANTGTSVIGALQTAVGTAGAFVINGGALGTPSSANLSSATGLPVSSGISGLGTNVATFLATPSSANFLNTVTGATGNGGGVVFANNATLVAPTLGAASATSLNKVTVTAPATGATLTLAEGSTLATVGAFSTTFTATGATTLTLPTSGTLATQAFVGSATVAQANNLTGTTPNLIPYQSASNTTTFLAAPAGNNYVLSANTTGAPYWAAASATGVTSVSAGTGMSFTTITGSGSVSIDTTVVPRFASTGTFTATQTYQNASNASAGLLVKNHATQQANPFEVQNSSGTALVSVSNTGTLYAVTIDGGTA